MAPQHLLHFKGTDAESARLDEIVLAPHVPEEPLAVAPGNVAGVVDAVFPDFAVEFVAAAVAHEDAVPPAMGHDDDLAFLVAFGEAAVLQLDAHVVEGRGPAHGAGMGAVEVGHHEHGLRLSEALAYFEAGQALYLQVHVGAHGFSSRGQALQAREVAGGGVASGKKAVDRRRRAEGGDAEAGHDAEQA